MIRINPYLEVHADAIIWNIRSRKIRMFLLDIHIYTVIAVIIRYRILGNGPFRPILVFSVSIRAYFK